MNRPALNACYAGDAREGLRAFAEAGIRAQTCVTSPPYWGLRDYGVLGQFGLESTPTEYVAAMVDVFRLVRDVLVDDGTLWVNLGDTYTSGGRETRDPGQSKLHPAFTGDENATTTNRAPTPPGLKPKDLIGVPWRVAFALQADGWYLRSDIIWHKPNPMPESVTDRCTKSHEYLFMFAKRERYYFAGDPIREPDSGQDHRRNVVEPIDRGQPNASPHTGLRRDAGRNGNGRNKRSVWTIPTEPYAGAHFAAMPTALVEPCILAGSRVGDIVLDPFMGSGTVAQVAQSLGRQWIGCELNPAYVELQKRRAAQLGMAFA